MAAVEQTGWVKPQRAPTYDEIMVRIGELRSELQELEQQASDMREATRLEALVKIRNIMRAQQLTIEDILPELRRPVRAGRD